MKEVKVKVCKINAPFSNLTLVTVQIRFRYDSMWKEEQVGSFRRAEKSRAGVSDARKRYYFLPLARFPVCAR